MLYAITFPGPSIDSDILEDEDEEVQQTRLQRKEFLAEFINNELQEIHSTALFLVEVAEWVANIDSWDGSSIQSFLGE